MQRRSWEPGRGWAAARARGVRGPLITTSGCLVSHPPPPGRRGGSRPAATEQPGSPTRVPSLPSAQVVVHFWAPWCEPCALLDTVLQQLAADRPGAVSVLRVEAEEAPEISEAYGVSVVPYFLFFKDGQRVDALEGADAAALSAKFAALAAGAPGGGGGAAVAAAAAAPPARQQQPGASASGEQAHSTGDGRSCMRLRCCGAQCVYLFNWTGRLQCMRASAATGAHAPAAATGRDGLQERLKALVSSQPVMLFMKVRRGSGGRVGRGLGGRVGWRVGPHTAQLSSQRSLSWECSRHLPPCAVGANGCPFKLPRCQLSSSRLHTGADK